MGTKGTKITILGAGCVGATVAYTIATAGTCSNILLVDINKDKAKGEAMDIRQGVSFGHNVEVHDGSYEDAVGSDIVVVTLGIARKPGQTRLDLAQTNVNIIKEVMPRMAKYAPDAIYVVVSNPVDVITYTILKCTDLKPSQVIGTGTALDTSRLRSSIADHVGLSPNSIHAYVFGEHGDTSMIPWSITNVAGIPMYDYCKQEGVDIDKDAIAVEVRKAGGEVIKQGCNILCDRNDSKQGLRQYSQRCKYNYDGFHTSGRKQIRYQRCLSQPSRSCRQTRY